MKSIYLMTMQMVSLIIMLISANGIIEDCAATIIFIVSFAMFARCCIYINKHQNELLKDIEREFNCN